MLAQQLGQHVGEAEHGVHRHAVGPGHRRQRVEGAEDEARAVDQDQVQASGSGPSGDLELLGMSVRQLAWSAPCRFSTIEARAIGAQHLLVVDVQTYPRMAERAARRRRRRPTRLVDRMISAAPASGGAVGAVWHGLPLGGGGARMIAMRRSGFNRWRAFLRRRPAEWPRRGPVSRRRVPGSAARACRCAATVRLPPRTAWCRRRRTRSSRCLTARACRYRPGCRTMGPARGGAGAARFQRQPRRLGNPGARLRNAPASRCCPRPARLRAGAAARPLARRRARWPATRAFMPRMLRAALSGVPG